jgi:hypothetical protein
MQIATAQGKRRRERFVIPPLQDLSLSNEGVADVEKECRTESKTPAFGSGPRIQHADRCTSMRHDALFLALRSFVSPMLVGRRVSLGSPWRSRGVKVSLWTKVRDPGPCATALEP